MFISRGTMDNEDISESFQQARMFNSYFSYIYAHVRSAKHFYIF